MVFTRSAGVERTYTEPRPFDTYTGLPKDFGIAHLKTIARVVKQG